MYSSVWLHPLMIPAYVGAASALVLILHLVLSFGPVKKLFRRPLIEEEGVQEQIPQHPSLHTSLFSAAREHITDLGGPVIFAFRVARAISVFVLCGLSIAIFVLDEEDVRKKGDGTDAPKHWSNKHQKRKGGSLSFTKHEWLEFAMVLTYVRSVPFYEL